MKDVTIETLVFGRLQEMCTAAGGSIAVNASLRLGDLGLDSLRLVELIFELEQSLDVATDEEQLARLETVGDVVAMFEGAAHEPIRISA